MWYHELNGEIAGPVSESEILDGRINSETLVWQSGMSGWQPARTVWPQFSPQFVTVAPPAVSVQEPEPEFHFSAPEPTTSHANQAFANGGLYQIQGDLVCAIDAHLPLCCVKCGTEAAPVRKKLDLEWIKPNNAATLGIALLFGPIGLLIQVLKNRRKASLNVSLCREHHDLWMKRERLGSIVACAGACMILLALFGAKAGSTIRAVSIVLAVGCILFSVVWSLIKKTPLIPKEIGSRMARFKGASPQIVARLPHWKLPID